MIQRLVQAFAKWHVIARSPAYKQHNPKGREIPHGTGRYTPIRLQKGQGDNSHRYPGAILEVRRFLDLSAGIELIIGCIGNSDYRKSENHFPAAERIIAIDGHCLFIDPGEVDPGFWHEGGEGRTSQIDWLNFNPSVPFSFF